MRSRLIDEYPRETVDFIPLLDLTVNGVPVVDAEDAEVAVTKEFARPTTWTPALVSGGQIGVKVDGGTLGRGVFRVFVRAAGSDTTPVIEAGYFRLT